MMDNFKSMRRGHKSVSSGICVSGTIGEADDFDRLGPPQIRLT